MKEQGLCTILDQDWARLLSLSSAPQSKLTLLCCFNPRFAPIVILRLANFLHIRKFGILAKLLSLINFIIFGLEVPASLEIGPGLVIAHTNGTVLGAAKIGENCTIFHQVTLGAKFPDFIYDLSKRPTINDNVTIYVGAKVLGPIIVEKGSIIGANSVVLDSVPANSVAFGIPALISPRHNNT